MKLGVFTSALALGGLFAIGTIAHPLNVKRAVVTEVVFVTETVADAIVYVDEKGQPWLTSTVKRVTSVPKTSAEPTPVASSSAVPTSAPVESPQPAPAPPPSPSSSVVVAVQSKELTTSSAPPLPPPPSPEPVPEPTPEAPAPAPVIKSEAPPAPPAPSKESDQTPEPKPSKFSDDSYPLGVTYDPYKGTDTNVQCKSAPEIEDDFNKMKEFGIVRIYGNDCEQIPAAVRMAKQNGQKLMGGIYAPHQDINVVVKALADAVRKYNDGNWDIIKLVSVENEKVNSREMSASAAQSTIGQARQALTGAGYNGFVGAVETVPAVIDNPSICSSSDAVLVNVHAWFDPNTEAKDAGKFVRSEVERVKKACGGKRVIVTESGWPHQGTSHDKAIASPDAQRAAIASIRAEFKSDLFLFHAFDTLWKTDNPETWNAEKYWGFM